MTFTVAPWARPLVKICFWKRWPARISIFFARRSSSAREGGVSPHLRQVHPDWIIDLLGRFSSSTVSFPSSDGQWLVPKIDSVGIESGEDLVDALW